MNTLKLFSGVLAQKTDVKLPVILEEYGVLIMPEALHLKKEIENYFRYQKLSGNQLNATFHKSWNKIATSSRFELLMHQILHYMTTYGTDFAGKTYIPDEILEVPDMKLCFIVVKGYSKEELIEKSLNMLKSGMALKQDTIEDLLNILDECKYKFTTQEGIKNKEAKVLIAERYDVFPLEPDDLMRILTYRITGKTLVIKDKNTIAAFKSVTKDVYLKKIHNLLTGNVYEFSEIFNRYKVLFLALRNNTYAKIIVNKISRLSKYNHSPMVQNPLNSVTNTVIAEKDMHWLENATPYALFKAYQALERRIEGKTNSFVYSIRNGKSWVADSKIDKSICSKNFSILLAFIENKFDLSGKSFYFPDNIDYAVPTSEKMYVGNIPMGTRIYGKNLCAGVYWRNEWGAYDIDLSAINIRGSKIGWNSAFKGSGLMYSGDMTSANPEAVEYLNASDGLDSAALVQANIFSGKNDCDYKIVVGNGHNITRNYMMDPNNLVLEAFCKSIQKQNIIGMFIPTEKGTTFVVFNVGAGNARVSGHNKLTNTAIDALMEKFSCAASFNSLVAFLGGNIVDSPEKADYDFSTNALEKDSFTRVFDDVLKEQSVIA